MSSDKQKLASVLAEEVLRAIYGDDYRGCKVTPDYVAGVIQKVLKDGGDHNQELIELYEKVIEAVDLLSTPPDITKVTDPEQLRVLLSHRLDGIHAVTTKTRQTTALFRQGPPAEHG